MHLCSSLITQRIGDNTRIVVLKRIAGMWGAYAAGAPTRRALLGGGPLLRRDFYTRIVVLKRIAGMWGAYAASAPGRRAAAAQRFLHTFKTISI